MDPEIRQWAEAADAFGYPPPSHDWEVRVDARLPVELARTVLAGVRDGLLVVDRYRFTLPALAAGKGPYAWFSRSSHREPAPNWEYFVQVQCWLEIRGCLPQKVTVGFEDDLMDVSVRRPDGAVDWCIEVKERDAQLRPLLAAIERYGRGVDVDAPDRGDDPLRKAKYIVRQRPRWLSLVALSARHDFAVEMEGDRAFRLIPTSVPLERVGRA